MTGANLQTIILWSAAAFAIYCALILLFRSAVVVARRSGAYFGVFGVKRAALRAQAEPGATYLPRMPQHIVDDAPFDVGQPQPTLATEQLTFVSRAKFDRKRVMNRGEFRVFRVVEEEVAASWPGYRVFSQTALGEIIESQDRDAHAAINSKRADVLVIDQAGYPVVVAEFQGSGHSAREDTAARDAVKKEALRRARVAYLEVLDHHSDDDIVRMLRDVFARARRKAA